MIPKYLKLKEAICEDIKNKKYPLYSKLPTEMELAEQYSLSRATVRQALDLMVQDKIIEKKWGSGNIVISTLDTLKSNQILVLLPNFKSSESNEFNEIFEDIKNTLYKEGLEALPINTDFSASKEREYLLSLLRDNYGGAIIWPVASGLPSINLDLYQRLLKRQTNTVFLHSYPNGINSGTLISYDDYNAGYQFSRSLINKGHKSLGGVFLYDDIRSLLRYSGFIDAIRDAGLPFDEAAFSFEATASLGADSVQSAVTLTKAPGPLTAKALIALKKTGVSNSINIAYKLR